MLTDYERDVLRYLNGESVDGLSWGAAMAAAIEHLHEAKYVERRGGGYFITDKGRKALKEARDAE